MRMQGGHSWDTGAGILRIISHWVYKPVGLRGYQWYRFLFFFGGVKRQNERSCSCLDFVTSLHCQAQLVLNAFWGRKKGKACNLFLEPNHSMSVAEGNLSNEANMSISAYIRYSHLQPGYQYLQLPSVLYRKHTKNIYT